MNYLILVRHGQSKWNLEKRFTGWVDVDLTENGKLEAEKAGYLIKKKNISIDLYYSSLQLRAKNTLKIIQKVLNDEKDFTKNWHINERHYGALTGLNKVEMSQKIGEDKVYLDEYVARGKIEIEALSYIRGRSINNAFMIIDEAQNLTAHEVKTILTRVGEGTKIVLTGDIEQIDNIYTNETSNGLTYAVEKFKCYDVSGHITFLKGERSRLATISSKIL